MAGYDDARLVVGRPVVYLLLGAASCNHDHGADQAVKLVLTLVATGDLATAGNLGWPT